MLPSGSLVDKYKEDRGWNLHLFARKVQSREKQLWKVGLEPRPLTQQSPPGTQDTSPPTAPKGGILGTAVGQTLLGQSHTLW